MKKLIVLCGILFFPLFCSNVAAASLPDEDSLSFHTGERLDSIVVNSWRAGLNTPVTFSQLSGKQLKKESTSHSLPMMLGLQPSVVATTEGGLGLGYTKMSVRGTDDSRTNVTVNGIAMNDSESQQVFWVNLPAIQTFLKSVQLQRGVGTSSNGSGAFGASLNMETTSAAPNPYGGAEFTYGSYKTYLSTIAAGTGTSSGGFSFDLVYSHGNTEGYIRNAKADLNSLYATAGWRGEKNSIKLSYILGDQSTGITWEGISLDEYYNGDRRYNVAGEYYDDQGNLHYYDNETDNYRQHYFQLAYSHLFTPNLSWNTTLNYTKGDGYYENYKYDSKFSKYGFENQEVDGQIYKNGDFIVQQAMANNYYAFNSTIALSTARVNGSAAVSYSYYDGDHFGDVIWSKINNEELAGSRWYFNNGTKQDYSVFARVEWNFLENLTAFADIQYRGVSYELKGPDKDFVDISWKNNYNFFNPKAGLTYSVSDNSRAYVSVAVAHKEPTRSDIKESIKSGTPDALKYERLTDVELGYRYNSQNLSFSANIYFMEYKDQLVATGKLSEVGYVIKENIPDSYRRGIELAAAVQLCKPLRLDANLTLSQNKACNYTAFVDTYDNADDWNPVAQTELFFDKTNLILSPEVVGMVMATLEPGRDFTLSLNGKYVGKQYMDNFNSDASGIPAYFVAGFNASKEFRLQGKSTLNLTFTLDNLLNNKYYSYGWLYQAYFKDGSDPYVEQGVYPQAPTNFMVRVAFRF